MIYQLDAPYYDGTIRVDPKNVLAVIWNNHGGADFVLTNGVTIRSVNNTKAQALAQAAGLQ